MSVLRWLRETLDKNVVFRRCPVHGGWRFWCGQDSNECSNCGQTEYPCCLYSLKARVSPYGEAVYPQLEPVNPKTFEKKAFSEIPLLLCEPCSKSANKLLTEDAAISNFVIELDELPKDVTPIISHYLYHAVIKCPFH